MNKADARALLATEEWHKLKHAIQKLANQAPPSLSMEDIAKAALMDIGMLKVFGIVENLALDLVKHEVKPLGAPFDTWGEDQEDKEDKENQTK